jgi:hypothetical protein
MRLHSALLLLTLVGLTAGCVLGPGTVIRDRFDYSATVADSWKSQMLLNFVRTRYGDTEVFLDVGRPPRPGTSLAFRSRTRTFPRATRRSRS